MNLIKKGPDVAAAAKVGEPLLVEPQPVAASELMKNQVKPAMPDAGPKGSLGVEIINPQPAGANQPAGDPAPTGGSPFGTAAAATAQPAAPDPNELKPNAPADPNELKPTDSTPDQTLPPPPQVNEIQQGQSSSSATASADNSTPASDEEVSSSKKKKKKGLKKIVPF